MQESVPETITQYIDYPYVIDGVQQTPCNIVFWFFQALHRHIQLLQAFFLVDDTFLTKNIMTPC